MANNALKPIIGNTVVRVMKVNELSRCAFQGRVVLPLVRLKACSK